MNKIALFLMFICISIAVSAQKDTSLMTIDVKVTNFKNVPLKGEKIILEAVKTKKSYSGVSGADGTFKIDVPKGKEYTVKYLTINDKLDYENFEVPNFDGTATMKLTIKIEVSKQYELKNVFFDTDKATLKPISFTALSNLLEVMKLKPNMIVEISGHTDNVGDNTHNLKLSKDRAESVKAYLVKNKIAENRIITKGYGADKPISDNDTQEGRQQNRRTEVKIIKE